jgi:diaminopimelate epimerase
MARRFAKYEGLGNDFVIVDEDVPPTDAVRLCDRRRGIGGDGVVMSLSAISAKHDGRMRVVNADGSVPEMCGNGIRCLALHIAIARAVDSAELVIATDAGPRRCSVKREGSTAIVRVDMGVVRFVGDRDVDLGGRTVHVAVADAGNPHAVMFGDFDDEALDDLGPRLASSPAFPNGTNVELATVEDGAIRLGVWERGVGRTLACGTGACATAVVAMAKGLVRGTVRVSLPGGDLTIEPSIADASTFMTGPARLVFRGETP